MSYIKVYVHFVWSTKDRYPFLNDSIRNQLFAHIRENAKKKNIYIDFINGYTDHVHILVSLNDDLSIGKIAQLIKGESSHWINQMQLTVGKFEWQDEYLAIGVGDDKLDIVRNYIAKQPEHHKKVLSAEEYNKFIERFGFDIVRLNTESTT
jgi:REP element-mobilizing transposase RayT